MPTVVTPRRAAVLTAFLIALYPALSLSSQGAREPWEELDKRVTAASTFATLGPDAFGDSVNLANGALSFAETDVSVPGNNALPVALGRSFSVENRAEQSNNLSFAEWDIEVPKISGTFAPNWEAGGGSPRPNRCSGYPVPPVPYSQPEANPNDIWNGITLSIPGSASGELLQIDAGTPRPSVGGPYVWTLSDGQTVVSCLGTIKNTTGEGFLVHTPDGSKYWFDWMAQYPILDMVVGNTSIPRRTNVLYATRVEDRFGNWVTYTYTNAWNTPARLQSIASSDGRSIGVTYGTDGHIATVTSGTQTWTYQYAARNNAMRPNEKTLRTVILPDNSRWTLNFEGLTNAYIEYPTNTASEPSGRNCYNHPPNITTPGTNQGTITHPAGGQARFTIAYQRQSRSNVPIACTNIEAPTNNTYNDLNTWPISYDSFALSEKQVSGPGLPTWTWTYSYTSTRSYVFPPGASPSNPVCTTETCDVPVCTSDACAGTATTTVTGPNSEWKRLTYGNSYRYNEGKLLKVESGSSSTNILDTQFFSYDLSTAADKPYPKRYGTSPRWVGQGWVAEYHRPQNSAATSRQGEAFSLTNEVFDARARPTQVWRRSTVLDSQGQPYSKRDLITFRDDTTRWILGQTASVQDQETGLYPMQMSFTTTSLPLTLSQFGRTVQTYGFNTDGTLATITDGRNHTTIFSNWYRGVPRSVLFPDSTSKSATVNERGWITSVTDQNGFVTGYGHDAMGRTSSITPPSGDTVAWTGTSISYAQAAATDMGLPVGHWKRSETRGNYRKETWFDGLWRPVVEREWDNANAAATQRFKGWAHDHAGRATFDAYPIASATSIASFSSGVRFAFDSLGRPVASTQDSELGALTTATEYLSGFQVRTTNPRGQQTTTTFQAFDAPDTSMPRVIQMPEGVTTEIVRDDFGKPTQISRSGSYAGSAQSVVRRYVYDTQQRLCKAIDPESGVTQYAYDASNNPTMIAEGTGLTALTCDSNNAPLALRTIRSYDPMNRVTLIDYPFGTEDVSNEYTVDGRLYRTSSDGSVWTYAYNRLGLLRSEDLSIDGASYSFSHGYNALGHSTSITYPVGGTVTYGRNALGQTTAISGYLSGISYFPDGTLSSMSYGNGVVRTQWQNARRLIQRTQDARNGTMLFDETYAYDANGNMDYIDDVAPGGIGDRDLGYDGLDRLLVADAPQMWGAASFQYDALDNLRVSIQGSRHYRIQYNTTTNLPTSVTNGTGAQLWSISHNGVGDITTNRAMSHSFDVAHRLRAVTGIANYSYDGHGRRTRETPNGGATQHQVYTLDGEKRLFKNGTAINRFIYLDGTLVAIDPYSNEVLGNRIYVHTNYLGSTEVRSNASTGQIQRRHYYTAYGEPWNSVIDGMGYAGHEMDQNTGLTYMQQRYYDPAIGRFLSVDPVGPLDNPINHFGRYHYANNNPYTFVDPDGRCGTRIQGASAVYCSSFKLAPDAGNQEPQGGSSAGELQGPNVAADIPTTPSSSDGSIPEPTSWLGYIHSVNVPTCTGAMGCWGYSAPPTMTDEQFFDNASMFVGGIGAGLAGKTAWGGGRSAWNNLSFDGPNAGARYANGRLFGIRWRDGKWGIRLDIHPYKGDPTNTPILHINYGPLRRGEAAHVTLYDPRWFK